MFEEKFREIERCAQIANIPNEVIDDLRLPKLTLQLKLRPPIRMREPIILAVVLFHNPYSTGIQPYKGGLRIAESARLPMLTRLGFDMTLKNALAKLRLGGGKSGIAINPKKYSNGELRLVVEDGVLQLTRYAKILDPDMFSAGPDTGTNKETMYWIYNKVGEENSKLHLPNVAAVVTGKPVERDGLPGREDATSRGALIALKELLRLTNGKNENLSIAIQGFGNVGMNLAKLSAPGNDLEISRFAKIAAVSDDAGGIYNPNGLDIPKVLAYYDEHKTFEGFSEADHIASEDPLFLPVDVIFPAACEDQIQEDNASRVQAGLIMPVANETITPKGLAHLEGDGKQVHSESATNVGGVAASFIEWADNRGKRHHDVETHQREQEVRHELTQIMTDVTYRVVTYSQEHRVSFTDAGYILSLKEIAEAHQMKHTY